MKHPFFTRLVIASITVQIAQLERTRALELQRGPKAPAAVPPTTPTEPLLSVGTREPSPAPASDRPSFRVEFVPSVAGTILVATTNALPPAGGLDGSSLVYGNHRLEIPN